MRTLRLVLAIVLAAAVSATAALPGYAVDQSKGYAGFCKDAKGVTVVVDFGKLGGTPIVRCDPAGTGTGLDALKGAGFQIAGVQRWGESFICRIENRPSAAQKLSIPGDSNYHEACIDTPPATAYWSYWHAGNNCAWDYSQWGVKNRTVTPGSFEGWSFSLNASSGSNPAPRIAAVRPGTAGGCNAAAEPTPTTSSRTETQNRAATASASAGTSADGALPAPRPRATASATAADPSNNVAYSGGEDAKDVRKQAQADSTSWTPWLAAGLILAIVAAAGWTARRRRLARGDGS